MADIGCDTDSPLAFPARWDQEKSLTPASLTRALRDVRMALGLPSLTPHDMRRTAASVLLASIEAQLLHGALGLGFIIWILSSLQSTLAGILLSSPPWRRVGASRSTERALTEVKSPLPAFPSTWLKPLDGTDFRLHPLGD